MNIIAGIILVTLFIDLLLNSLADYLNLKVLKDELPQQFEGLYDAEGYRKSQEYLRVNTRFSWIVSGFSLAVTLAFWFGKGFPLLDRWVNSFEMGPIVSGLVYIGILMFFKAIISVPFSIYETFVIEERFGFNKTTWSTFIIDMLKGLLVGTVLGGTLLSGIFGFFEYAGANAWLFCWIAVSGFMLIMQLIVPTWILPLFNKFTPIEDGELKDGILAYAGSINYSLENIYMMDGSKRSSKANAFFTGFGRHKRIVLYDTLIKLLSTRELIAILAHEMGHFKKKHILFTIVIGIVHMGIMFFLLSFFISYKGLFDAFYMEHVSIYAGLIFFGMLYSPIDFFTGFFLQMLSRKNEYDADRFSAETTGDPEPFISALQKLSVSNLSNLSPHPFYVLLNYSHPPVLDRIKAIKSMDN